MAPGTFQALGIPLLQGRDFQNSDINNSPLVTIIDEPLARRYWPAGDAIGKRIQTDGNRQWLTIVGIVGGVKHISLAEEKRPHMYFPMAQIRLIRARRSSCALMVHPARRFQLSELRSSKSIRTCRCTWSDR